jgi:hypothetical protein
MSILIPELLQNYIPSELYCDTNLQLFDAIMDGILTKDVIQEENTMHFVVESLIKFAANEDHYTLLVKWLENNAIYTGTGQLVDRVEFSKKHKHEAMKRVWSSVQISLEKKKQLLGKLEAEVGEGEWLDNTRKYCDAAHFEHKEKIWKLITSKEKNETENWGLAESKSLYAGWNQV